MGRSRRPSSVRHWPTGRKQAELAATPEKQNGESAYDNIARANHLLALPDHLPHRGHGQDRQCQWSRPARRIQAALNRGISHTRSVLFRHTLLTDKTRGSHGGPSYSKKRWTHDFQGCSISYMNHSRMSFTTLLSGDQLLCVRGSR